MLISTVGGNHFTILPAVYKDSNVSKSSPTTILFVVLGLFFFFLNRGHPSGYKVISHCWFNLSFSSVGNSMEGGASGNLESTGSQELEATELLNNSSDKRCWESFHMFIGYSLEKCIFRSFAHSLNGLFCCWAVKSSLHILNINHLSDTLFIIFSHSIVIFSLLFLLMCVSFYVWRGPINLCLLLVPVLLIL